MVAEPECSEVDPGAPKPWAAAAMTSSEGSGMITPRQGPRIRNEEEEEQVIPVRSSTALGDGRVGISPTLASEMSGF